MTDVAGMRYKADITAGALKLPESRIIADLLKFDTVKAVLDGGFPEAIARAVPGGGAGPQEGSETPDGNAEPVRGWPAARRTTGREGKRQRLMDGFKGRDNQSAMSVPNEELVLVYAAHDLQANIVALAEAVYRALDGDTGAIGKLSLYPSSQFTIENERMAEERPTTSDIQAWLSQAEGGR